MVLGNVDVEKPFKLILRELDYNWETQYTTPGIQKLSILKTVRGNIFVPAYKAHQSTLMDTY